MLRSSSMLQLIDAGEETLHDLRKSSCTSTEMPNNGLPLPEVELISPIPRPRQNIMCLGWNYIEHVEETSGKALEAPKLPKYPIIFTKVRFQYEWPLCRYSLSTWTFLIRWTGK